MKKLQVCQPGFALGLRFANLELCYWYYTEISISGQVTETGCSSVKITESSVHYSHRDVKKKTIVDEQDPSHQAD